MNELLSIAIPTRNRAHYLSALLESINGQYTGELANLIHIYIYNNGSTDDTEQRVNHANIQFAHTYFNHGYNKGGDENIIYSYTHTSGKYTWVIGDDELLPPDSLQEIIRLMLKYSPVLILNRAPLYEPFMNVAECYKNYRHFASECLQHNPHMLIAHSLISANIIRSDCFDFDFAKQQIKTNYGHFFGIINSILAKNGPVVFPDIMTLIVRINRAGMQFDEGGGLERIAFGQVQYLSWLMERLGNQNIIPGRIVDDYQRRVARIQGNVSFQEKQRREVQLVQSICHKCDGEVLETSDIPITFLVAVYNEEKRIRHVLEHAVRWADEIIVVNKSSTDKTKEICLEYGDKVRVVDIPFSPRGHDDTVAAIQHATYDWVFFGTASEVPTRKLIRQAREVLNQTKGALDLVYVPRKMYSMGIHSPASPWYISYYPFLVNRRQAVITNTIHQNFRPRNPNRAYKIEYEEDCYVLHPTHSSAKTYLEDMAQYFEAEAAGCDNPELKIQQCFAAINLFEERLRKGGKELQGAYCAWPIYQLGTILFLWEKQRGMNVEKYYQELKDELLAREWGDRSDTAASGVPVPTGASDAKPMPRVSAIVSCYKAEKYLRGCLDDLEGQTMAAELEIVVVDSGSPTNERGIVEDYQKRYGNIVYVRTEQRETVYAAWNRGLKTARGRYVTSANSDDRHRPDALEILARTLDEHPDVTLVYADCLITRTENETFATAHPVGKFQWLEFNRQDLATKGCFVGPQPMWRREIHQRHGYFDEAFVSAGDYEFWMRIAGAEKFRHVNQVLGLYLESPASVEHANRDRAAQEVLLAQGRYRNALLADASDVATTNQTNQGFRPSAVELPDAGKIGRLKKGYEARQKGKHRETWTAGLTALQVRPYHPECYVMMGEAARDAGNVALARQCGERAHQLAPKFSLAIELLNSLPASGRTKSLKWPALPEWPGAGADPGAKTASRRPRLSVCLIAKNEEEFIGRCLGSIRQMASQIVMVDTGSSDRTVAIAKEHGAEVHSFAWNDNFSDARNVALARATGDWILMLDADEELPESEHDKLLAEMQDPGVLGYRLPIVNHGMEAEGIAYVPRLFRNAPGLFYVGRVHEQVFPSVVVRCGEWGLQTKLGTATILHYGYDATVVRNRQKVNRNLNLLLQAVKELPDEPNLEMNLGLELVRSGKLDEGVKHYLVAFDLMSQQPQTQVVPELREALLTQLTTHLMRQKNHLEIVRVLGSPLAQPLGMTASLHYTLGFACFQLGRYADTVEQMRLCLAKRAEPVLSPIVKEIKTVAPRHVLAVCLANLKENQTADMTFREAMQEDPRSRPVRYDYARFHFSQDRPVEALKLLHGLIGEKPDEAAVWELGGQIGLSKPEFLEFAGDWTGEAMKQFPDHPMIIAQRAEVLLLNQQTDESLPLWRKLPAPQSPRHVAAIVLCEIMGNSLNGVMQDADETLVSQEFIHWYRRLVQAGAETLIRGLNQRLDRVRRVLPRAAQLLEGVAAAADKK